MKGVSAAFTDSLRIDSIGNDEFHTVIDAHSTKKRPSGKLGHFATCVRESADAIARQLRGKSDHDPIFLTGDAMGIEKFSQVLRNSFLSPVIRAHRDSLR